MATAECAWYKYISNVSLSLSLCLVFRQLSDYKIGCVHAKKNTGGLYAHKTTTECSRERGLHTEVAPRCVRDRDPPHARVHPTRMAAARVHACRVTAGAAPGRPARASTASTTTDAASVTRLPWVQARGSPLSRSTVVGRLGRRAQVGVAGEGPRLRAAVAAPAAAVGAARMRVRER